MSQRPTQPVPSWEGPRLINAMLWIGVTFLARSKDGKPSKGSTLLGPFADDKEANLARHIHGKQVAMHELPGQWNHAYIYLITSHSGGLQPYDLERDDLESHPYLVFTKDHDGKEGKLRVSKNDKWQPFRVFKPGEEQCREVTTEQLRPGDRITVPYWAGPVLETVIGVTRVRLYWDREETD